MITRLHLTVMIAIGVGSIAVTRLAAGEVVSVGWFTSIGVAVAVNMAVISCFNVWIWRWDIWQGWFVRRPHLWGDWDVTVETFWESPDTHERPGPVAGNMTIKQTYAAIHIRLETAESKGDLVSARIVENGDGRYKIAGVYRNEPKLERRESSQIHNGAFLLEVKGNANKPTGLEGHYWTDRLTSGQLTVTRRARQPTKSNGRGEQP